jgi:hypothetical protein
VEIRIGILNSPREIGFETSQPASEIEKAVAAALESDAKVLSLTDSKGNKYIIPTAGIGYVEIGSEESRRVGFVG